MRSTGRRCRWNNVRNRPTNLWRLGWVRRRSLATDRLGPPWRDGRLTPEIVQAAPGPRDAQAGQSQAGIAPRTKAGRRSRTFAATLAGRRWRGWGFIEGAGRLAQGWLPTLSTRPDEGERSYPETAPPGSMPGSTSFLVFAMADQVVRLEIIKKVARGPEDVRAFNLIVVNYNSRCSDFLYQDKDLARVNAVIAARRTEIEAEQTNLGRDVRTSRGVPLNGSRQHKTTTGSALRGPELADPPALQTPW